MHRPHISLFTALALVGLVRGVSAQAEPAVEPAPEPAPAPTPDEEPAPEAAPITAPVETPAAAATPAPADEFDLSSLGLDASTGFDDKLRIYGFADFGYTATWLESPLLADYRGFGVGNLNVYLAKNLTSKWRTLTEVRFLFSPNGTVKADGTVTDTTTTDPANQYRSIQWGGIKIERSYLEYDLHPKLTIRAGHWLSPYGIWNVDHGSPTIISTTKPYVIGEQFIPEHQTGLHAFGSYHADDYRIGYHATVSNGRSPVSGIEDLDAKPAFGGRLELSLASTPLDLGVSIYTGQATQAAATFLDKPVSYHEVAYAADAVWRSGGFMIQGEIMRRDRRYLAGRRPVSLGGFVPNGHDLGMYALVGYRFERAWNVMPFAVFDHYRTIEPIFFREVTAASAGLNFRPTSSVVLKVMATYGASDGVGIYGELGRIQQLNTQASWVF